MPPEKPTVKTPETVSPPATPPTPNYVDSTFIGYGGQPGQVNNWQAIALTAIDVFSRWGFGTNA